ncbi:MAG: sensor histidine kinase [Anaerolineae bacterium]|nr:sensor histidine kinase [Anaerolineae bacterium]
MELHGFAGRSLDELRSLAPEGCTLLHVCPPEELTLQADPVLLRNILNNLLSNAIKYSPHGGSVTLRTWHDDQSVTLEVTDQGIGIPKEDQARLFQSFHRAGNTAGIRGTGLGLVILKHAVDLHGGEVDFWSEVGQGSRFTVRLPRQP